MTNNKKSKEPVLIRIYRFIHYVFIIGSFVLIVWTSTTIQGFLDGFISGLFFGCLIAFIIWLSGKYVIDQAAEAIEWLPVHYKRLTRKTYCPQCNTLLPRYRIPSSKRQFRDGGWTCKKCGCEIDYEGHEIVIT